MRNVYTVAQVNSYIKNMFSQDFMLQNIYVKGEVSNCKYHSSGHIYFTMKDADGTINAVMFAGSRREGLKFPMKEGDRVVVTGSVEVYERDGRYQIYARTIERDGEGNLYLKFEALKHQGSKGERFTADIVGEKAGESGRTVHRYIRLTELISGMLEMVDNNIINVGIGERLSYLRKKVK